MKDCNICLNHEFVIVDANFIIETINFVFDTTPDLDEEIFITRLEQVLNKIQACSINNKLNIPQLVFDRELDVYRTQSAIKRKSKLFRTFPYNRDNKQNFNNLLRSLFKIIPVNNNDLQIMIQFAKDNYRYPPSREDLSLIVMGLNESHEKDFNCIILSDDTDLNKLIENHLIIAENLQRYDNHYWDTTKILEMDFLEYLINIFGCCEFTYQESFDMIDYYWEDFHNRRHGLGEWKKEVKAILIRKSVKKFFEQSRKKLNIGVKSNV